MSACRSSGGGVGLLAATQQVIHKGRRMRSCSSAFGAAMKHRGAVASLIGPRERDNRAAMKHRGAGASLIGPRERDNRAAMKHRGAVASLIGPQERDNRAAMKHRGAVASLIGPRCYRARWMMESRTGWLMSIAV